MLFEHDGPCFLLYCEMAEMTPPGYFTYLFISFDRLPLSHTHTCMRRRIKPSKDHNKGKKH